MELDAKLKQLPTWELAAYLRVLEAGMLPEFLAPAVGSKPQKENQGDVDEGGGHLNDRVKILYVEGYKPKTVLTQGMEDVISIISNLLSPCLQCESSYPQQPTLC